MTSETSDGEPAAVDSTVLDNLSRMVGAETSTEIVDLFLSCGPARLTAVRNGAESGDFESCADALHSLKSSAGMLGANRLCELAARMERLSGEGDHDAMAALVERLLDAYGEAEILLRARCDRSEGE